MYHNFFIHSFVDGRLGCFHVPAIVKSAAMNIGVHISLRIVVFSGKMHSSGIAGSYDSFIPSLGNLHTVLQSGCINSYSHQQCKKVPILAHSLKGLLVVDFFDEGHSAGLRCYLIVILICISLLMSNVEHLFMYLLAIFGEMSL